MLVGAENITYFVPKPAKAGDDIVIDVSQRYPHGTITLHLLLNHKARIVYSNGKDKVVDYKVGLLSVSLEPLGQPRSLKRPRAIRQEQEQEGAGEAKTTIEDSTVVVPGMPKVTPADVEQADVGQEETIDHASLLNELRLNRQMTLQPASSVVASQRSQNLTKVAPMTKIVPASNDALKEVAEYM